MSKSLGGLHLRRAAEHGELLHGGVRHGTVLLWQQHRPRGGWGRVKPQNDLAQAMSAHMGQTDRYVSVNQFDGWRLVKLLRSLRAVYVDLDGFRDIYAVLDALQTLRIPEPTFYVESGRGMHLYWVLEPLPPQALPVWQAVQDKLVAALAKFGADPVAKDCTRVLRIVGSINGKNGQEVLGWILSNQTWSLRELANEVLGERVMMPKATVSAMHAARARRQVGVAQQTARYSLWYGRYRDLCLIADHHRYMRPEGVQEGKRDTLLFLLGVSLSWFAAPTALYEEVCRVAQAYMPSFSAREVATYTRPLLQRADAAHRGEMIEWNGQQVDPRYRFRTDTMRSWLGDLITPELEPQLVALGQPKSDEERQAVRKAQWAARDKTRSRVQEGRYEQTRAAYLADASERAQRAQQLRAEGHSLRAIATLMGASVASIHGWCSKSAPLCIAPAG